MKNLNILKFLLILLYPVLSSSGCSYLIPYHAPDEFDRPQLDAELQAKLEVIVFDLGLEKAVHDKRLNFAFADLSNLNKPVMAGMNESNIMYAASLPKIAILFGLFKRLENGDLEYTDQISKWAEDMTSKSSNTAATELFNLVGPKFIISLMTDERYKLYDIDRFGGLWVGKEYGKSPAILLDPIAGTSHGATAFSVLRFYYLLETGQLLNPRLTQQMREVLSRSAFHTKFLKGIRGCCPGSILLRKAGSWRNWAADGALVLNNKKRYVIAGFADDPQGEEWLEKLAPRLDELAKERLY